MLNGERYCLVLTVFLLACVVVKGNSSYSPPPTSEHRVVKTRLGLFSDHIRTLGS